MKEIVRRIALDIKNNYIALLSLLVLNIIVRKWFHAFCPFLIVTGFPCAGCGLTRGAFYIITGQFARGMNLNPAAPLWVFVIAFFIVWRYILGRNMKCVMCLFGVVCVITFIIYGYRMFTQFPGNPPMTYYRSNLMLNVYKIIEEVLK